MMISRVVIRATTPTGPVAGTFTFGPGFNILTGPNHYGKSTAATAIAWCLGIEPMFGLPDNDPSRFPPAVRDEVDLEAGPQPVLRSEAEVTFKSDKGGQLRLTRAIHGEPPALVKVEELDADGRLFRSSVLSARRNAMADETGGLQRFLFSWFGLPHVHVMTSRGTPSEVYLENLAPLFFIDQSEGWTDIQSLQVYRYQQLAISEVAVEYLLGARTVLGLRFGEQKAQANRARLKAAAQALSARVATTFAKQGFPYTPSTHGTPRQIAARLARQSLAETALLEFSMDIVAERKVLSQRIETLRTTLLERKVDGFSLAAASHASQDVVALKTRRHDLRLRLRTASAQMADQKHLLENTTQRVQSSKDVLRLKEQGVGRFEHLECPTCHRDIAPESLSLTEHSLGSVRAHIVSLEKQQQLLSTTIAVLQAESTRLAAELEEIEDRLRSAEQTLMAVNAATGPTSEELAKAAMDLAGAERKMARLQTWSDEIASLQQEIDAWIADALATPDDEEGAGRRDPAIEEFVQQLGRALLSVGHSAVREQDVPFITVDERYVPFLGARRLRALGSASDHPRLVAAYSLALAAAAHARTAPHPGFVFLDEPIQQNPDPAHREMLMRVFERSARSEQPFQTIVLTSLFPPEVQRLRKAGVTVTELQGKHLLAPSQDGTGTAP